MCLYVVGSVVRGVYGQASGGENVYNVVDYCVMSV